VGRKAELQSTGYNWTVITDQVKFQTGPNYSTWNGPSRPFQTKTNEHIFHRSALRMDGGLKRREILTDRAHNGRQLKKIIYWLISWCLLDNKESLNTNKQSPSNFALSKFLILLHLTCSVHVQKLESVTIITTMHRSSWRKNESPFSLHFFFDIFHNMNGSVR
jgi:hypothetical protein